MSEKLIDNVEILENEILENFKLDIFESNVPHFFIQNGLNDKRFRISMNVKELNHKFGSKIKIIRDFNRLVELSTKFDLLEKSETIENSFKINLKYKQFSSLSYYTSFYNKDNLNTCVSSCPLENEDPRPFSNGKITIEKIRFKLNNTNSSVFLITKNYKDEVNQALITFSDKYHNIEELLCQYQQLINSNQ